MEEDNLKINTFVGTIFGLITAGLYWVLYLTSWSRRHAMQKLVTYEHLYDIDTTTIQDRIKRSSKRTLALGWTATVMIAVGLVLSLFSLLWEVFLDKGPTPIISDVEALFWLYLWLASAMLPVTYGSLLFELRYILEVERTDPIASRLRKPSSLPALPSGGAGAIICIALIHFVLALGLLPLLIFPPIIASSINKYVDAQQQMWS